MMRRYWAGLLAVSLLTLVAPRLQAEETAETVPVDGAGKAAEAPAAAAVPAPASEQDDVSAITDLQTEIARLNKDVNKKEQVQVQTHDVRKRNAHE